MDHKGRLRMKGAFSVSGVREEILFLAEYDLDYA